MAIGGGFNKTLTLRGIKDSPPYLHDGRRGVLQSDSAVQLTAQEKTELVTFLRTLGTAEDSRASSRDYRWTRKGACDPTKG
jgi:hypothetical protein